ncbi:MAG: hypothetical protein ACT4QE_26305 [Anaerolineales bacterium]
MFSDRPLTKRQLGWLIIATGLVAAASVVLADAFGAGRFSGLGPAQWQALGGCALVVVLGLSLVPLGDRLA